VESANEKDKTKVLAVAENFGWFLSPRSKNSTLPHDFSLSFTDYSRNIAHLQTDKKWKLVNRTLLNGTVYLNQAEVSRLLEEEIKKNIEKRLDISGLSHLPPEVIEIVERIKKLAEEKIGKNELEGFPKIVIKEAFPPCINFLYAAASSSHHLSHMGRFTLTSFLVTIGMPPEQVAEVFKTFSDYNARLTRYQVGHIAGEKGSGTKYTPPNCSTLQTHGVCTNSDDLCQNIHNPLTYYRIRQRSTSGEEPNL
jgi:DNA primase large subunit